MIAFKIDQQITCEKICRAVQEMLNSANHIDDILVIEIKKIYQTTDDLIPKLTHEVINE